MSVVNRLSRNLGKKLPLILGAMALFYAPAFAQTAPTGPVPEPPAPVEDFSLPSSTSPPPQPTPEEPIRQPAPAETIAPPAADQTVPAQSQPVTRTSEPESQISAQPDIKPQPDTLSVSREPQTSDNQTTDSSPSPSRADIKTPDTEAVPQQKQDDPAIDSTANEPPEPVEQITPAPAKAVTGKRAKNEYLLPAAILATLVAIGFWLNFRRKRKKLASADNETSETLSPSNEDAPDSPSAPETDKQDNRSEISHAAEAVGKDPEPIDTADDLATIEDQNPQPSQPLASQPQKQEEAHHIETIFTASHASSTLINAVVGYQIDINNVTSDPVSNLTISGTMIQADHNIVESASSSQGMILQELESLSAGESKTVSGEIRHPLNSFSPIEYQSQKLLVPLVLLRFDYDDQDGKTHMQTSVYVIGTEYVPPRAKMAPFRLDQGPKNYENVAHRPFQS